MKSSRKNLSFAILFLSSLVFFGCASTDVTVPYHKGIPERTEIVQINNGLVRGVKNPTKTVELFAGVPFAKPPVGDLRWKEPEDCENWEGILDADHFAALGMQKQRSKVFTTVFNRVISSPGDRTDYAPKSEDCLYLNIWRPANYDESEKLPVVVYVHGGSLRRCGSWYEDWDGEYFAEQGIIFVSIAYRLGIYGFYAHPQLAEESPNHTTGNYGLLDQIKALEWVNENIGYFGGDVSNITIAGESAGSSSVSALCCSPLSKGLFNRAIGESSSLVVPVPAHTFRSREEAIRVGEDIMNYYECTSIEEMRKIPAEKLLERSYENNAMTVDPYSMPEYPWQLYQKGLNHEEALLNGFNADEATAFILTQLPDKRSYKRLFAESPYITDVEGLCSLRRVFTDFDALFFYADVFATITFTYPHYSWTKVVTEQGKPVYEYYFTKDNGGLGAFHMGEVVYAYGNLKASKQRNYDKSDYALEKTMSTYWLNFIKYGNPNGNPADPSYGTELPYWETSAESNGKLLELGKKINMRDDPFLDIYQYLDFDIYAKDHKGNVQIDE